MRDGQSMTGKVADKEEKIRGFFLFTLSAEK
jgi:hypothetical protein